MSLYISNDHTNSATETFEQDTHEPPSNSLTDSQSSKKADLAGPGIGDYNELEEDSSRRLQPAPDSERNAKGNFPSETLYRRQSM